LQPEWMDLGPFNISLDTDQADIIVGVSGQVDLKCWRPRRDIRPNIERNEGGGKDIKGSKTIKQENGKQQRRRVRLMKPQKHAKVTEGR
jgi:hypothetical protein